MRKLYVRDSWRAGAIPDDAASARDRIKEAFSDISFNEKEHIYTLDGRNIPSVSSIVERYSSFDKEAVAKRTFERHFGNKESKYYQKSVEEILAMWNSVSEAACDRGHDAHSFAEACFYVATGEPDKAPLFKERISDDGTSITAESPLEEAAILAYDAIKEGYIPIAAENIVYNRKLWYAGTFDLLVHNEKTGKNVIMDWKTNIDLDKNFQGECLKTPFNDLLDKPESHYILQLSLYQQALEDAGIKVGGRCLLHLKDSGEFEARNLQNVGARLREELSK